MKYATITNQARHLQREIWRHKDNLWPNCQLRPIQMLQPETACRVLGLNYQEFDNSGTTFSFRGQRYKAAGLIDRQARKVAIAHGLSPHVARFTGAHEIGHWLCHPDEVMHRDLPVDGSRTLDSKRPIAEREADYFAGAFLIPERLLEEAFESRFGKVPYSINEHIAYWLNPSDPESLLRIEEKSLDRELALAGCRSFNGKSFYNLAESFGVSKQAMAIRLKQLKFIRWP